MAKKTAGTAKEAPGADDGLEPALLDHVVAAVNRLVARGKERGRITYDDVIDVAEAEATEDLLRFGGVSPNEELGGDWSSAVRSRLPWLYVNLFTAFLAASVVYHFQDSIGRLTALAVWMPIIAGMVTIQR